MWRKLGGAFVKHATLSSILVSWSRFPYTPAGPMPLVELPSSTGIIKVKVPNGFNTWFRLAVQKKKKRAGFHWQGPSIDRLFPRGFYESENSGILNGTLPARETTCGFHLHHTASGLRGQNLALSHVHCKIFEPVGISSRTVGLPFKLTFKDDILCGHRLTLDEPKPSCDWRTRSCARVATWRWELILKNLKAGCYLWIRAKIKINEQKIISWVDGCHFGHPQCSMSRACGKCEVSHHTGSHAPPSIITTREIKIKLRQQKLWNIPRDQIYPSIPTPEKDGCMMRA